MRGYTGTIAGVEFDDGEAVTDPDAITNPERASQAILSYARRHGLRVDGDRLVVVEPGDPDRQDSRDVTLQRLGTPLRDAAVDPQPEDFLPPVNAGLADPHSTAVVSPEIHGSEDKRVTPGPVHVDDPAAQEAKETAQAVEERTDGDDVDAPAKSANKPEWVAYAISQGADPDEAKAATKEQLVDVYGGEG